MSSAVSVVDTCISQLEVLKKNLNKKAGIQITSNDERMLLAATSATWFEHHRPQFKFLGEETLSGINISYHELMDSSSKKPSRKNVIREIGYLRKKLLELRKKILEEGSVIVTEDSPPDFSPLIADERMRNLLSKRWRECSACINYDLPLAATVMIGGFVEGMLISKVNQEKDQSKIFKSKSAPMDKKTSSPKPLSDWKLNDLINLAHELGWISKPMKDISGILREYRNYIHPHKEYAHDIVITNSDTKMFWELSKSITRQLLGVE